MRVSELAEALSTTADTVRYYTRQGFLRPLKDAQNGYKFYRSEDIQRLRFILSARQLGFAVEDIGRILAEADGGQRPCATTRALLAQRLAETEQRFQQMLELRETMRTALQRWEEQGDEAPAPAGICPLIEDFACDGKSVHADGVHADSDVS